MRSWGLKQRNKLLMIKLITENFVQQKAPNKQYIITPDDYDQL